MFPVSFHYQSTSKSNPMLKVIIIQTSEKYNNNQLRTGDHRPLKLRHKIRN